MKKRNINRVIVHCSATENKKKFTGSVIDRWHRERGWLMIGYHFVIRTDGSIEFGRPLHMAGAHARGYNKDSIGICLIGGVDADDQPKNNFTRKQMKSLQGLIALLMDVYQLDVEDIVGHLPLAGILVVARGQMPRLTFIF